mmetsp:Transcript_8175/g.16078  ORF Transcript_8175/g.16078 Transcript_8175/m.16078 type:complete len:214 (-) Transcript_8175:628-1269(-)
MAAVRKSKSKSKNKNKTTTTATTAATAAAIANNNRKIGVGGIAVFICLSCCCYVAVVGGRLSAQEQQQHHQQHQHQDLDMFSSFFFRRGFGLQRRQYQQWLGQGVGERVKKQSSSKSSSSPNSRRTKTAATGSINEQNTHNARIAWITAPNRGVADSIGSGLVEGKLAACVSTIPGVRSTYRWKGKLEHDEEILLMVGRRKEEHQNKPHPCVH